MGIMRYTIQSRQSKRKQDMKHAILIGNLCTLFAMGFNAFSSTRKTPKGVLMTQNVSQAIYGFSAIALGGYSAVVQNVVSIFRNTAAILNVNSKLLEWLFVILGVTLGIAFNNLGWVGMLPVIANLQYTLAIFHFKDDERKLKLFFLFNSFAFILFNFAIQNYVGAAADTFVAITTITMLVKSRPKNEE